MTRVPQYFAISQGFRQQPDGRWTSIGQETVQQLRTDSLARAVAWVRERSRPELSVRLSWERKMIVMKRVGETELTNMLVGGVDELADFAA